MTERRDDEMRGKPPDPPEPFDPSTREFPAVDPKEEREAGRPFIPPDLEEEMGGSLNLDADLEKARDLEADRIEHRRDAVPMDTSTFMAIPAPSPSGPFEPPEFDEKQGRLGRSTAFFSIATAFSRVAGAGRAVAAAGGLGILA